jgi:hypothetical protein
MSRSELSGWLLWLSGLFAGAGSVYLGQAVYWTWFA